MIANATARRPPDRQAGKGPATVTVEVEIGALIDRRSAAIREKDIDQLLSFYSSDVIYFDIGPPLQHVGAAALRSRFSNWFASYEGPIGQEVHSLRVDTAGDVAMASMLIRTGGTLVNGAAVDLWVRATSCCRRTAPDSWLITHEHVSLPVDLASS
jgi:ketosteroid isomerase-like protein